MRYLLVFIFITSVLGVSSSSAQTQSLSLEKRVKQFYKIEENKKLTERDKTELLKEFIAPGQERDSLAVYFYQSWLKVTSSTKRLKSKIKNITYADDNTKATITTVDIVTDYQRIKVTYTSKVLWHKINDSWYRSNQKSDYKNGQPVR